MDGINVVKHDGKFVQNGEWAYKIQGFSCESNEKHAKCSSCKLIYRHAQQQCKSIHQSTRTYLFKWVRRNDTWITLDCICSISISSIRILFVLFYFPSIVAVRGYNIIFERCWFFFNRFFWNFGHFCHFGHFGEIRNIFSRFQRIGSYNRWC